MGFWDDAEVIHAYSRAQAIADGVLVDVSNAAAEAGFKLPCAMTRDAWVDAVEWSEYDEARKAEGTGQSLLGRLWDVLYLAHLAARHGRGQDRVTFTVSRVPREGASVTPEPMQLVMHIGPGDTAEPVLTIMLPGED
jgi:hypothetical protein